MISLSIVNIIFHVVGMVEGEIKENYIFMSLDVIALKVFSNTYPLIESCVLVNWTMITD